jgi:hypothetical protein
MRLKKGRHLGVAPAAVAHLRPGIEVLRLAAHEHHPVDRAGAAEQLAARYGVNPVQMSEGGWAGSGLRVMALFGSGSSVRHTLRLPFSQIDPGQSFCLPHDSNSGQSYRFAPIVSASAQCQCADLLNPRRKQGVILPASRYISRSAAPRAAGIGGRDLLSRPGNLGPPSRTPPASPSRAYDRNSR